MESFFLHFGFVAFIFLVIVIFAKFMNIQLEVVEGLVGNNTKKKDGNHDDKKDAKKDGKKEGAGGDHDIKDMSAIQQELDNDIEDMETEMRADMELEVHLDRLLHENDEMTQSMDIPNQRDIYQECIVEQARNITLKLIQKALKMPFKDDRLLTKHLEEMNTWNASLATLNTCNKNIVF